MSRNIEEIKLGSNVYIHQYNPISADIVIRLHELLKSNNINILTNINDCDSLIYIPKDNEFKLSYELEHDLHIQNFLETHTKENIFLAYEKVKTKELNIYPFNLEKNMGRSGEALDFTPKFDSLIDRVIYNLTNKY